SVPKAVTPSYTRAYHAALHRESLQRLPCPSLPRCVLCSIPGHLLRPMPASDFRVPVPVTAGCTGAGKFHFFKNDYYIHFVPTALSCPLPAF
ncbi:unnamed protein product, partial [Staurois parvus]